MLTNKMTIVQREKLTGWMFVLPFVLGFVLFFLIPLVQTIIYSFSKIDVVSSGIRITSVGNANFRRALFEDPDFGPIFIDSCRTTIIDCVGIVVFSLIVSNLLNGKFKGRTIARAIMFLPVVIASGVVYRAQYNELSAVINSYFNNNDITLFNNTTDFLSSAMRVSQGLLNYVLSVVERVYAIIRSSGVQILLYLAGLQTISSAFYEASSLEGATGWENFWKITLPMISPYIMVNIVYTIVDQTGNFGNSIIVFLYNQTMKAHDYGFGAAVGWIYMIFVALFISIVLFVVSKFVFYHD